MLTLIQLKIDQITQLAADIEDTLKSELAPEQKIEIARQYNNQIQALLASLYLKPE